MEEYNILICDDEQPIIDLLKLYLHDETYRIFEASDGLKALDILKKEAIDIILLDIMMPKLNGLDLIKRIRDSFHKPILIISARTSLSDRLLAYDIGADDYITKPFEPLEVLAKVKARLRNKAAHENKITIGDITLSLESCMLKVKDETYELSSVEFKVLRLFMQNAGRVFAKSQIYEAGWEVEYFYDDNSIHVIINRLRSKVGADRIQTIRGLGYRFCKEE
ncbi:MAG: response regulator transcription factor [Christensenellaceae bacterium]|nr:response regulator transcription factor [Christensenellaceae bacterium]